MEIKMLVNVNVLHTHTHTHTFDYYRHVKNKLEINIYVNLVKEVSP